MDPDLRAAVEELHRRVDANAVETRRHFDVVGEGLRTEVRLVAEGVTALSERVDRVEGNLIQSLEARVGELGQRYGDLESRLHRLEAGR